MIVPRYWAEGRIRRREAGRQLTIRRFGWSDVSPEEAQAMADQRTREAFDRAWAGERLPQREHKTAYNGAEGLPIREEILSTHGTTVITRNSYGAACLNTPDVFFADVDFDDTQARCMTNLGCSTFPAIFLAAVTTFLITRSMSYAIVALVVAFCGWSLMMLVASRVLRAMLPKPDLAARKKIQAFVEAHPEWALRLYQTPAGFRLLATHRTFDPTSEEVAKAMSELGTDSVYTTMCRRQACFRARLSAKPWRAGVDSHLRPRPGVWPIAPEKMAARQAWVRQYEAAAAKFAACRFIEALGNRTVHPRVREVQRIHDQLSRAESTLPLA